ncbi:hypothetical protein D3C80_21640 [compost metagenome]
MYKVLNKLRKIRNVETVKKSLSYVEIILIFAAVIFVISQWKAMVEKVAGS